MRGVSGAVWPDKAELVSVWKKCFGDSPRYIHYFFNNLFDPKNCLVYREEGKIVSMLQMLPGWISQAGEMVQSHYIYGAATLPEYRSRGIMGELLQASFEVGQARGDIYSFLLPANRNLYRFYGKFGYKVGFQLRTLAVCREEMERVASGGKQWPILPDYERVCAVRQQWLSGYSGSAHWNARHIAYAAGVNRLENGKILCSVTKGELSYALCRPANEQGACEVLELSARPETLPDLAANLVGAVGAEQYFLRLPVEDPLFAGRGRRAGFGMIHPLVKEAALPLGESPYLGLTLD